MRANFVICIILALALIICPVAALKGDVPSDQELSEAITEDVQSESENDYISVMSSLTGRVEKTDMREYIIGCVAAEMNADYHSEALKAQAVACYTYAKKACEQNEKHKDSSLGNADISDSPETHQGYLNLKGRKEKWGDKHEEYEAKITAAVDEVLGKYLVFEGETALAVYYAISAGSTQSAKSLWDSDIPYLISVESPGDRLSPDYMSVAKFSESEFRKIAKKCGVNLSEEPEEWLGKIEKSDSGYTTSVILGETKISASKIREEFGLRSLCFDVAYTGDEFVFTSRGYGHGVGMSQYGADYMARQGFSWKEILSHYYPGTEVV